MAARPHTGGRLIAVVFDVAKGLIEKLIRPKESRRLRMVTFNTEG
jgi:hypothetical protein